MSKALQIGHGLSLPLDAVTRRIGILGMSGSGKTTTAAVITEEILKNGLPTAIIDPKDDFWGLRSSRDGKHPGLPITVLGGEHGDAPLEETSGKLIADLVVEAAPQLVLSMAHFSKSAMRRFVTDFAEQLYHRNREAVNLILDETDLFAPQKIRKGEERMFGAIDDIVRRGRKRGIGVTMICQRSAIINKDILTQCELLIAHRANHPLDIDPVVVWMRAARMPEEKLAQVEDTIAKLKNGEAWVMSPQWLKKFARVQMRDRETFDSSATPEAGKRVAAPKRLAEVDLDILKTRMAETIERAKATDPREMQKRIAELQAQVKKLEAAKVPAAKVEIQEVPVLKEGQLKRIEALFEKGTKISTDIKDGLGMLAQVVAPAIPTLRYPSGQLPMPPSRVGQPRPANGAQLPAGASKMHNLHQPTPANRAPVAPRAPSGDQQATGDVKLNRGAREMLRALAAFNGRGLTRAELGVHAVLGYQTGTFSDYLSALRRAGYIIDDGPRLGITAEGLAAAGGVQPAKGWAELVSAWTRRKVGGGARRMLEALAHHRTPVSREVLGEQAQLGHETGTFSDYLSLLRRNGLIEDGPGRGEVHASPALFLSEEQAGG